MNNNTIQPLLFFQRLSFKINALISFLIIITGLGIGGYAIYQDYLQAKSALINNSYNIAQIIANNAEYGFYTKNSDDLEQKALLLGHRHDLVHIQFLLDSNKLLVEHLFSGNISEIGPLLADSVFDEALLKEYEDFIHLRLPVKNSSIESDDPLWQELSIDSKVLGWVEILVSKKKMHGEIYNTAFSVFLFILLSILIALGLAFFVIRNITEPLAKLTQASATVAQGDFSISLVNLDKQDDVGLLFNSFAHMLNNIKEMRAQLLNHRDELESKIVERTEDLRLETNRAVDLADKANQANKMKTEFLSVMSHEIRTPMNAVIGMLELLNDTELSEDQRELLDIASNSSQNLLVVINDILDFSKIESGSVELDLLEFSLKEVVDFAIVNMNVLATQNSITVESKFLSNYSEILLGDSIRLNQILLNLLGNAIKFTEPGGKVAIHVEQEILNDNECNVIFHVIDNGIGIKPEQQSALFDAFVQADSSNNRLFEGTGLGLAIVKRLVHLMHGEVRVESVFGKGSCFIFNVHFQYLASHRRLINILPIENVAVSDSFNEQQLNYKILLVDDTSTNLLLIQKHLIKLGFVNLVSVSSGQAAVDAVLESEYDLILMDCQMPEMDGFSATKAIREYQLSVQQARVPIIALTAKAFDNDRKRCLEVGMDEYLSKPFSRVQLVAVLKKVLSI